MSGIPVPFFRNCGIISPDWWFKSVRNTQPYWTISTKPDAALVNDMLDGAISQLGEAEYPMIHSDRGCHYRWPGWISRMEKAGLERSVSKKDAPLTILPVRGYLAV